MNKELAKEYLEKINIISSEIGKSVTIMEICGGHTNTILRYGIRDVLPSNIQLISGPGCPVCVSSQRDIDCMIELAKNGVPIATYGDMMRVPGSEVSLEEIKSEGGKVFEVYSATEVLKLRDDYPDIVFFGIGFETTTPMTAFLLENNVCVYSVHKLVPPALKALLDGEVSIDGFIDPGHVSVIIGSDAYEGINIPQAIAGFYPDEILRALMDLLELIRDNKKIVVNSYPSAVSKEGNKLAQNSFKKHFVVSDSEWRGLGVIPLSGLEVRDDKLNAKIKYKEFLDKVPTPKKSACRCGDILKGKINPNECPLYGKVCTPSKPVGACMVSAEGTCSVYYGYENE